MKKSDYDAKAAAIAIIMATAEKFKSAMIARDQIGDFTGGALSPRYLANLDCLGQGPEGSFKLGRRTVYPVDSLVRWLIARIEA